MRWVVRVCVCARGWVCSSAVRPAAPFPCVRFRGRWAFTSARVRPLQGNPRTTARRPLCLARSRPYPSLRCSPDRPALCLLFCLPDFFSRTGSGPPASSVMNAAAAAAFRCACMSRSIASPPRLRFLPPAAERCRSPSPPLPRSASSQPCAPASEPPPPASSGVTLSVRGAGRASAATPPSPATSLSPSPPASVSR